MNSPEELKLALDTILVPGIERSLVKMNLIKNISVADGNAGITLFNAALMKDTREWLSEQIKDVLSAVDGIKEVDVSYEEGNPKDLNKVKNVIAVMSGKGGVGKSLVSGLAAIALRRQGYDVGILDGDITGPSIPKMFGVSGMPPVAENGLLPVPSSSGVQIMSLNLLLPAEDDAVIWRGPLIGQTIKQFWEDVLWGNLDYLIVDLPPGTADAPLTTLQQLPISGIIIVFTPQDLTAMVVRKAVNMAKKMDKKIIGVVENMSYLYIPELNKKMELFGKSRGEEMSRVSGAPLLGILPIDPELVKLCDEGGIERYSGDAYSAFAQKLISTLK